MPILIDISALYCHTDTAKLAELDSNVAKALDLAGAGNEVTLTGAGPIWLYLRD